MPFRVATVRSNVTASRPSVSDVVGVKPLGWDKVGRLYAKGNTLDTCPPEVTTTGTAAPCPAGTVKVTESWYPLG